MRTFISTMRTDLFWYHTLQERVVVDCQIDRDNASQQQIPMSLRGRLKAEVFVTSDSELRVAPVALFPPVSLESWIRSPSGLVKQLGTRVRVRDGPESVVQCAFLVG